MEIAKNILNMKKLILPILFLLIISCKKEDGGLLTTSVKEFSFDSDANSKLMFKDGDPVEKMTAESMRYEIAKVLRVKAINETTIEIANFAPVDIEDATILLTIEGQAKPIKLFQIKKIRAHGTQEIKYPFVEGTKMFLDTDNKEIDLSMYKVGIATTKVSFDFTGESDLIKKLKSLSQLKWKVKSHDFDPNHDPNNNWKNNVDAKDFRRLTGYIINIAYLLQSDGTKTAFLAEPIYDKDGLTLMTLEQKKGAYQKYLDIPTINCGVVVNVTGLGGGSTFGLADYIIRDYLKQEAVESGIHEIGHMIGYPHESSMTYPKKIEGVYRGATEAIKKVCVEMLKKDEFPIKKTNYYKPTDSQ